MDITVSQGARGVGLLDTETRLVRDVEDMLQELEPQEGPLTQILSRLTTDTATDNKVEWFEDQLLPDFDVLAAALTAGAATMTVTNFAYFRKGDIVRINDYEQVYVSATPTTTSVSITRAFGTVPATAADSGARLHIVSDATQENGLGRDVITTQKVPRYNYCQQLGTPCEWSDLDLASKTFGEKELPAEHRKQIVEHKKKMEKSFILGQPYLSTSGNLVTGVSGGLEYFIQSNIKDVSGGFTEAEFEDWLRVCFRYGGSEKLVFCSPKAIQSVNGFARAKMQTFTNDDTYGVTITEYHNAGRKVGLIEQKLLTNASLNDLTGIAGHMILVDPANIKMAYLQGQSTHVAEKIQANDQRGRKDEVRSTFSFKCFLEQTHGLLTGVQD